MAVMVCYVSYCKKQGLPLMGSRPCSEGRAMQVYEEITPQEMKAEQKEMQMTVQKRGTPPVLIQTVICVLILAAALFLKYVLPAVYEEARMWYDDEMAKSVLITYDDVSSL